MTQHDELVKEILKVRKDLDLEREDHQLTQLKYEHMKDNLDKLINDKLNAARESVQEVVNDRNKK